MSLLRERRLGKRIKRWLRYGLIQMAWRTLSWIPVSWGYYLGRWVGQGAYLIARGERRQALESVTRAFPNLSATALAQLIKDNFIHLGRTALEWVCIEQIDSDIEHWVVWPEADRQVLDRALAKGKGVVFVSGHVGNWELLARRVGLAGYPARTIARESSDPRLTAFIQALREKGNVKSIWRGQKDAARQMLKALKLGEILGFLIDQDTRVQSVFVPFFGHLAATPRAPADLALRTGAALVVGFCQRAGGRKYQLSMKELEVGKIKRSPERSEGRLEAREKEVNALTAQLNLEIETAIRKDPSQWVWMHRRWKTSVVALAGLALLHCAPHPSDAQREVHPDVVLHSARMRVFRGSEEISQGTAEEWVYERSTGEYLAKNANLRAKSKDRPNALTSNIDLRSPHLRGNALSHQAYGYGGVAADAEQGLHGKTEEAHYDGNGQRAEGAHPVAIDGPGYHLKSSRFVFHLADEEFEFDGQVTSRLGDVH